MLDGLAIHRADRASAVVIAGFANGWSAACAGGARATGADQGDDDAVTNRETLHARPDCRDGPGGLVSVDGWQIPAPCTIGILDIRVADRAGLDLDFDLAVDRRTQMDIFDDQRLAELVTHRSFDLLHVPVLPAASGPPNPIARSLTGISVAWQVRKRRLTLGQCRACCEP